MEQRIKDVICPQCKEKFILRWEDYTDYKERIEAEGKAAEITLVVRSCPSGGIYDVSIKCPYCNYEEEL